MKVKKKINKVAKGFEKLSKKPNESQKNHKNDLTSQEETWGNEWKGKN